MFNVKVYEVNAAFDSVIFRFAWLSVSDYKRVYNLLLFLLYKYGSINSMRSKGMGGKGEEHVM